MSIRPRVTEAPFQPDGNRLAVVLNAGWRAGLKTDTHSLNPEYNKDYSREHVYAVARNRLSRESYPNAALSTLAFWEHVIKYANELKDHARSKRMYSWIAPLDAIIEDANRHLRMG